jgi:hypothetical protein
MMYKLIALLCSCKALELLSQESDADIHSVLDSYMEREEPDYNWFEVADAQRRSPNGGTIHFLNVTS